MYFFLSSYLLRVLKYNVNDELGPVSYDLWIKQNQFYSFLLPFSIHVGTKQNNSFINTKYIGVYINNKLSIQNQYR